MRKPIAGIVSAFALASGLLIAPLAGRDATFPPNATDAPPSKVPTIGYQKPSPAVLELRRRLLDPASMPLELHHLNEVFNSQEIANGKSAKPFPRAIRPLTFSYSFNGQTIPAEQVFDRTFTSALLIIKDGRIAYERYGNYTTEKSRFNSMSLAKSITSILIGIAVQQGAITSLDDQLTTFIPELKGTAYDGVTLRDAMHMKTGVDRSDADQLKPGTIAASRRELMLVQNARHLVDEAFMVERKAEPGKTFDYSTLNATVVGWVLERATKQPITDFTSRWLWQPLGAESPAFWLVDGADQKARPMTGLGFNATLRDFGRIGQMMLDMGRVDGRQVVPAKWVEETTRGVHAPTAPGSPIGYQYMWWTMPGQPAFTGIGVQGQYLFVDPSTRTVIVKLSYVPGSGGAIGQETMAFLKAAAAWDGK